MVFVAVSPNWFFVRPCVPPCDFVRAHSLKTKNVKNQNWRQTFKGQSFKGKSHQYYKS